MSEKKNILEIQTPEEIKIEYKEVTLFKNPIIILSSSFMMLLEQITKSIKYLISHKIFLILLIVISISTLFEGPHKDVKIIKHL